MRRGRRRKARLAAIAAERAGLQKRLAAEFPDYAALSNPLPVKTDEIQTLLATDEATVVFSVLDKQSYVIAVTRDGFDWKPISLGADDIAKKVAAFRRGLDVNHATDASDKSGLFDLALANELYATLLGPVESLIDQGQAESSCCSFRRTYGLAVSSAGDREAPGGDPCNACRLSRGGVVDQASGGFGAAIGRKPEGTSRLCPQRPSRKAAHRIRQSRV